MRRKAAVAPSLKGASCHFGNGVKMTLPTSVRIKCTMRATRWIIMSCCLLSPSPSADSAFEPVQLLPADGTEGEWFGMSASISCDVAVIGAPRGDNDGPGSAYVFGYDGSTWIQQQELLASDGAAGDSFGIASSMSGEVVVVGAQADDDNGDRSGSAYVFRYDGSTWIQEQKLLPSDGAAGDWFGFSVSISGDVAVIGAAGDDESGAAYIFRYDGSTWIQEQKLLPSDGAADDWFGLSVSISGDVAVAGAFGDDVGSAYVFRHDGSTWIEEQKLLASDGAVDDWFGFTVSMSDDVVVVGNFADNDNGSASGSAYVFRHDGSTWIEEQKLLASDGSSPDWFGYRVSIGGDVIAVGAVQDSDNGLTSGSAYVFRYDGSTWLQEQKLLAPGGQAEDRFGTSVSVSGDVVLVGAAGDDDNGDGAGSAFVFRSCPWDLDGDGDVGITDFLDLLGAWGPNPGHPADFDGDDIVGITDFLELLGNWGPCP